MITKKYLFLIQDPILKTTYLIPMVHSEYSRCEVQVHGIGALHTTLFITPIEAEEESVGNTILPFKFKFKSML